MAGTSPAMTAESHRATSQVVTLRRLRVLGILEHDAHGFKLVADAIGFGKVFGFAGGIAICDPTIDG